MKTSATFSFTIPIELSIQMDVYIEEHGLKRSQFIKNAIVSFLNEKHKKEMMPKLMEDIYKEIIDVKQNLTKMNIKDSE
jgi:metal-responsive CopG/Arc/MetJ family transcriptional regulator